MVAVVSIVLLLLRAMPVEGYFNDFDKVSQTQIDVKLTQLGLKDPAPVQIVRYFGRLVKGDLGVSSRYRAGYPITRILAAKAPVSIRLGCAALLISLLLGFALGIRMARSSQTKHALFDRLGILFVVAVQAVPAAVYHILIQLYGTEIFGFPMLFDRRNWTSWILPVFSLSLGNISFYAIWLRRYMRDESNKDYVRLARAKGLPENRVWRGHILRNAVVPLVQYIPEAVLTTVMGALYVESLYSVPGMGGLLVQAIRIQDNTLVQALVVLFTMISMAGMLLGDLLLAFVDPRIAFESRRGGRR